ncbi:MAG: glycosyltransferase [Candidatus Andersenbacteria bacterium]
MHVALFTDTYAPQLNGVATVVTNLARELARRGHEVTVATVTSPDGGAEADAQARADGYRVVRYASAELPTYKEMRVALPTVLKSVRWALKSRPNLIHVQTPFGIGWEGVALAKTFEVPLVGTHHTFIQDYMGHVKLDVPGANTMARKVVSAFYNRCDLVTAPSKAMVDDLRTSGVTVPVELLRNPVDVARFARAPSLRDAGRTALKLTGPTLLYFGRVSYEKNLPVLLEAAEPVLRALPEARLLIGGDGPVRAELEASVKRAGLEQQVLFLGRLTGDDLVRAVGASDVFASTSLTENQPVSVIEAQAAGLPGVVFAERGMPEIVTDGVSGRVIKTGDVAAFSATLLELLGDATLRGKLAEGARANAQRYTIESVGADLLALYEKLLP